MLDLFGNVVKKTDNTTENVEAFYYPYTNEMDEAVVIYVVHEDKKPLSDYNVWTGEASRLDHDDIL